MALAVSAANAQCVMCFRTAAAQQMERARVLNIGIGIMLLPPVVILAGFLYLAYRRNLSFVEELPDYDRDSESASPSAEAVEQHELGSRSLGCVEDSARR